MGSGVKPLLSKSKANAKSILAAAMARGYKRRRGKHLFESIGSRLRVYTNKGTTFVAAGGLYREGGFHAHLVEFGHKVVSGGTMARPGRKAGITAAGMRFLDENKITTRQRRKLGDYHVGLLKNTKLRGGGRTTGSAGPHPFLKPAWDATKENCLHIIIEEVKLKLIDQAVLYAQSQGVK